MQFKILSVLAVALSVQSTAYAMSSTQQAQAMKRGKAVEQSQAMNQGQAMNQTQAMNQGQAMDQTQAMQQGQAGIKSKDIIDALNDISQTFADVSDALAHLSVANLVTNVPKVIKDLVKLFGSVTKGLANFINPLSGGQLPKEDEASVCEAFHQFTESNHKVVKNIVGEEGILANNPFSGIISAIVTAIEMVVNSFASGLIGVIPACKEETQAKV